MMTVLGYTFHPSGAIVGLLFSTGALLVIWRILANRPRLSYRLEPYLREPVGTSPLLITHTPFPQVERLLRPILADVNRILNRLGSQANSVQTRLQRAGGERSVENFRIEQIIWATAGLGIGLFLAIAFFATSRTNPILLGILVFGAAITAALGRDYLLTRQVNAREQTMAAEFPTIAELLALSVSAGESPLAAIERVANVTSGELSTELQAVLADVRSGIPLPQALAAMAARTNVASIVRFTEGVATAIERGTPLAQVLRSQAEDARSAGHHALIEVGGKKEITMMIPVVFLLLPVTVLFALFPGLHMLSLS